MIKVSVLYPDMDGSRFDMNYYLSTHMRLVEDKLGAACKGINVEQGLSGAEPGTRPAYVCMGHMLFDSVQAFQDAFAPHAEVIMADIANYTDIQPVIQISDIKM